MQQFEIWRLRAPRGRGRATQLVVVVQHRLFQDFHTCVVAPLQLSAELPAIGRLRPEIGLEGSRYRLIVDRLSVVRTMDLAECAGSAASSADAIKRALDELFYGI